MLDRDLFFLLLSWLFILPLFTIFEERTKNLSISIPISILSFVDDSFSISQEKSYKKSNVNLYCIYDIILSLFNQFGLAIKHDKSEVFHFSRLIKNTNSPLLDLRSMGGVVLKPKDTWQYLGFFFDKKYSLQHHIHYYTNKALSTIKDMKMLSNLIREHSPIHKCLLYRTCILPIALYSFQL